MAAEGKAPPRMIGSGPIAPLGPRAHGFVLLFLFRPCGDLFEGQRPVPIGDPERTVDMVMDDDFGRPRLVLDLIKLAMVGNGKVISKPPFGLDA